jgi:hypothetical protein
VEQVAWSLWQEGDDTVDGWKLLWGNLLHIGLQFSSVDGTFSEDEANFLFDVETFFRPELAEIELSGSQNVQIYLSTAGLLTPWLKLTAQLLPASRSF